MADLAKYVVQLELQNKQLIQGLDTANRRIAKFHRDQEKAVEGIKRSFISMGSTVASALSVQAIVRFTASSVKMADAIGKASRAAGTSAEELQKLRFAFNELGGVTEQQTDSGLARFNKTLGDALAGSKSARDNFNQLGVAIRSAGGQAVSTQAALNSTLRALAAIKSDAERASRAAELFGRELGPRMAASLKGGIGALEQTKEQIAGLISDQTVRDAEALNDAYERLSKTIGGELRNAVIGIAADFARWKGWIDFNELDVLNERIAKTQSQISILETELSKRLDSKGTIYGFLFGARTSEIDQLQRRLSQLKENLSVLQAAARAGTPKGGSDGGALDSGSNSALLAFIERAAQAEKLTESVRTKEEQRAAAIREANDLYTEGLISLETYQRKLDELRDKEAEHRQMREKYGFGPGGSMQILPELGTLEDRDALMREAEDQLVDHLKRRAQLIADAAREEVEANQYVAEQSLRWREYSFMTGAGLLRSLGDEHKGFAIAAIGIEKAMSIARVLQQGKAAAAQTKNYYEVAAAAHLAATAGMGTVYAATLRALGTASAAKILTQSKIAAGLIGLEGLGEALQVSRGGAEIGSIGNPAYTTTAPNIPSAQAVNEPRDGKVIEIHVHRGAYMNTRDLIKDLKREAKDADIQLFWE